MSYKAERRVELAAELTRNLVELNSEATKLYAPTKPTDSRFYGAAIYGICAAVLVCLSNTPLFWSFLAPGALGMTIGVGLVVADQFSLRSKFEPLYKYLSGS